MDRGGDAAMTTNILVLGEALIDAVDDGTGPIRDYVGGSPANVAFGLAALDHPTLLATDVGTDPHGRLIVEACQRRGVELVLGSVTERPTSVAHATIGENGAATYVFDIFWKLPPIPQELAFGHVHTGSIAATLLPGADGVRDAIETSRGRATVSYDPNVRPSLMGSPGEVRDRIEQLVALSDVVKASDEDIAWLYPWTPIPDTLRRWASLGALLTVVTRGAEGAVVMLAQGQGTSVPALSGSVIDTVGAGDSFMAGLISGLTDSGLLGSLEARKRLAAADLAAVRPAIDRARATSGVTVTKAGGYAPSRAEIGAADRVDA